MGGRHTVVAMVQIETDDPRLSPEAVAAQLASVSGFAAMRATVLGHLATDVTRLIAVMPVEHAKMLMMLHEAYGAELGDGPFVRPPPGYVRPTRD